MAAVNRQLEGWIAARPEQWLWLHRRWPDWATRRAGQARPIDATISASIPGSTRR